MTGTQKLQIPMEAGEAMLAFIQTLTERGKDSAAKSIANLRKDFPNRKDDELANGLIFADSTLQDPVVGMVLADLRIMRPLLACGFSPISLTVIAKQVLLVLSLSEIFKNRLPRVSLPSLIVLFLIQEVHFDRVKSYCFYDLKTIEDFLAKGDVGQLSHEFVERFLGRCEWRNTAEKEAAGVPTSLLRVANFLLQKNIGLTAKYLFRDGKITDADLRNFKKAGEGTLEIILRTMISLAYADGALSSAAKDLIRRFCEEYRLICPPLDFQRFDATVLQQLPEVLVHPDEKEFFFACLRELASLEGNTSEVKAEFLSMIRQALNLE